MKIIYLLIAISAGGNVSQTEFLTLDACENAKSIALYGETTEEYKAIDERIASEGKEYENKFYAVHPPREPKTDQEKSIIDRVKKSGGFSSSSWSPCGRDKVCGMSITDDYKIQDTPGPYIGNGFGPSYNPKAGEWTDYFHGKFVLRHSGDVKTARCIETTTPAEVTTP